MNKHLTDPLEKAVARALAENTQENSLRQSDESREKSLTVEREGVRTSVAGEMNRDSQFRELEFVEVDLTRLREKNIVGHSYASMESNVFSMLRAQVLQKMQRNHCRSLAILGPTEGVGKSFLAVNIALSLAKQKHLNVSLLDFDLRKPTIANIFGVKRDHQVADYLFGHCDLHDIGFRTQIEQLSIYAGQGGTADAAELLAGNRSHRLLKELTPRPNDLVIVDLPPLCGMADVHTLLPHCDAALLIIEYARTSRREIEESKKLIGTTPLVGSIINRGRLSGASTYGYGYGFVDSGSTD